MGSILRRRHMPHKLMSCIQSLHKSQKTWRWMFFNHIRYEWMSSSYCHFFSVTRGPNNIEGRTINIVFLSFIHSFIFGWYPDLKFFFFFFTVPKGKVWHTTTSKYNKHVQLILTCDLKFLSGGRSLHNLIFF